MGFYGNITNTSNTTFQYDRIYPNRVEMDANATTDGIFVGRHVLIEYGDKISYPIIYKEKENFYVSNPLEPGGGGAQHIKVIYRGAGVRPEEEKHPFDTTGFYKNEIAQVYIIGNNSKDITGVAFYQCTGEKSGYATFQLVSETDNTYIINSFIDANKYNGAFYDSTVWVKVTNTEKKKSTDPEVKYVQIAELNSVIPTISLAVDPPTQVPISPYFDANSNNFSYIMHVQPTMGMRVGIDDVYSDEKTEWTKYEYDSAAKKEVLYYATGVNSKGEPIWQKATSGALSTPALNAAIYYNKDAFLPQVGVEPSKIIKHTPNTKRADGIQISQGKSGNKYGATKEVKEDVMELSIYLPTIGNMISDVWDIVHGIDRDNYKGQKKDKDSTKNYSSLQGRLDSFSEMSNNTIPIKREQDGAIIGTTINGGTNISIENSTMLLNTSDINYYYPKDNTKDDPWITTIINSNNGKNSISIHHSFNKIGNTNGNSDYVSKQITPLYEIGTSQQQKAIQQYLPDDDSVIKGKLPIYIPYVDQTGHVIGCHTNYVTIPNDSEKLKISNYTTPDVLGNEKEYGIKHAETLNDALANIDIIYTYIETIDCGDSRPN